MKIDNNSFVKSGRVQILGNNFNKTNSIQEEIKSRLESENVRSYLVQNILPSILFFKNLKIKIYRTIILPVILFECESWSLIMKEEPRLRLSESRVFRRIFVPKRDGVTEERRKLHNEELNDLKHRL
jgi:hypothetical protein